jgi:hypothetical protein
MPAKNEPRNTTATATTASIALTVMFGVITTRVLLTDPSLAMVRGSGVGVLLVHGKANPAWTAGRAVACVARPLPIRSHFPRLDCTKMVNRFSNLTQLPSHLCYWKLQQSQSVKCIVTFISSKVDHFPLAFAHLAFCAAAILARPSTLIFLRWGLGVVAGFELTGRPRFDAVV